MSIKEALFELSSRQLQQVVSIKQQIEGLEAELEGVVRGEASSQSAVRSAPAAGEGRRRISSKGRARIAAAQRQRWAKARGAAGAARASATGKSAPGRRKLTPAQKAKIAAAARKRWAAAKAAGRSHL